MRRRPLRANGFAVRCHRPGRLRDEFRLGWQQLEWPVRHRQQAWSRFSAGQLPVHGHSQWQAPGAGWGDPAVFGRRVADDCTVAVATDPQRPGSSFALGLHAAQQKASPAASPVSRARHHLELRRSSSPRRSPRPRGDCRVRPSVAPRGLAPGVGHAAWLWQHDASVRTHGVIRAEGPSLTLKTVFVGCWILPRADHKLSAARDYFGFPPMPSDTFLTPRPCNLPNNSATCKYFSS